MAVVDIGDLSLDMQAFVLTGMYFDEMCDYVAKHVLCNEEEREDSNAKAID